MNLKTELTLSEEEIQSLERLTKSQSGRVALDIIEVLKERLDACREQIAILRSGQGLTDAEAKLAKIQAILGIPQPVCGGPSAP